MSDPRHRRDSTRDLSSRSPAIRKPHRTRHDATILVYDSRGTIFDLLRAVPWNVPLRLVTDGPEAITGRGGLAILAAYEWTDWTLAAQLSSKTPTIVVSARFDPTKASGALSFGLAGYLDADLPAPALKRAVLGVLNGELAFPRITLGRWIRSRRRTVRRPRTGTLTPRQQEVVELVATGATDKEIAGVLGIRTVTAQKHVAHILARLGVPNRAAAVAALTES